MITEPNDIFNEIVGKFLHDAFAGSPDEQREAFRAMVITARAMFRFSRDVGPIVFPGVSDGAIQTQLATFIGQASREISKRANVDGSQMKMIILAFSLGIELGATEANPSTSADSSPDGTPSTESIARVLACACQHRLKHADVGALREELTRCVRAAEGITEFADEISRNAWATKYQRVIESVAAWLALASTEASSASARNGG